MPKGRAVPNLVGQTIDAGRLSIIEVLGAGSNGVVFLAEDTASPSTHTHYYAVKCMPKALFGTRRFRNQRQEIQNHMAASTIPNVVTLHRVIEDHRFYYLVMDYYPAGDLFHYLARGGIARGDDTRIKRIMVQIIDAVRECHHIGIFHRDIKPENIMINTDGTRVYLSDFGLSTTQRYSTTFGCGSQYYMSPECLGKLGVDPAYSTRTNDVWALGIILTAMITGHNPWHQASYFDACYRAYIEDPMFLRNTLPISDEVNDVLKRIFSPSPNRITLEFLRLQILSIDKFYELFKPAPPRRRSFFRRRRHPQRRESSPQPPNYIEPPTYEPAVVVVPRSQRTSQDVVSASDTDSHGPRTPDRTEELHDIPPMSELPDYDSLGRSDILVAAENGQAGPPRGFFKRMAGRLYM
ncbi:kinase-like protein [Rhodofomes roseus]|uniref:non-specific serine/threonine protein kinase n=1 Tax=Rhodofomes roseus TaxID=34475 RepID=A0ABQ8K3E3_9APHY|nr:kinase-like protein [Rhodofomes roseus]KAH9831164.1 kinase-like protein [Rhodofomes roseus]